MKITTKTRAAQKSGKPKSAKTDGELRLFPDKGPHHLLDNTAFLVMDIGRLYRSIFDSKMQRLGLSRQEWLLMLYLCFFDGRTQQELADIMDVDKGAMAKLISKLEGKKFIRRVANGVDARQKRIYFTEEAKPFAAQLDGASVQLVGESVRALKAAEIVALHRQLRTLRVTLMSVSKNLIFTPP